jgi:hypothetical protein
MKNLITIAVIAVVLTGCGTVSHLTPGITTSNWIAAEIACEDHKGVHMVNVSACGFNAFCNDDSRQDI